MALNQDTRATVTRCLAGGEALLTHAAAQLEEIEARASLGRWTWDVATSAFTCTPQLIRIYALASPDLMPSADSFLLRVHQADRTRVRASIARALASGDTFQFQHRIVRLDDQIRVLRTRGTIVRGEDGKALRILGISQDITELHAADKRAEARLMQVSRRALDREERDLLAALRAEALRVGRQAAIPISISGDEISPRLPPGVETALFRLAQEAIANSARHAGCSLIRLSLTGTAAHARLEIQDNGSGFDVTTVAGSETGEPRGIALMRERAEGISASFRLTSQPGSGARITVDYRG